MDQFFPTLQILYGLLDRHTDLCQGFVTTICQVGLELCDQSIAIAHDMAFADLMMDSVFVGSRFEGIGIIGH